VHCAVVLAPECSQASCPPELQARPWLNMCGSIRACSTDSAPLQLDYGAEHSAACAEVEAARLVPLLWRHRIQLGR
jgi:hypothetical protein